MPKQIAADCNLAMEAVRVTEAAALAASLFMGCGDEKAADQAAVDAMQAALSSLTINGTVRIGEGREGEAGKLYVGEKVGTGEGTKTSVAIVPLEGKSIVARGGPNALSVIAMAEVGGFLSVPDIYMGIGGAITHSMVVRSVTGTLHYIEGHHDFSRRSRYG